MVLLILPVIIIVMMLLGRNQAGAAQISRLATGRDHPVVVHHRPAPGI